LIRLAVINGPNLNLLGKREKSIYGILSYNDLVDMIQNYAKSKSIEVEIFQSNSEGEIIDKIHQFGEYVDGFVINAAGLTHTSVAIRDALLGVNKPFIEVHISNIFSREEFRHKSYLSDKAIGVITGLGVYSYIYAIDYFTTYLKGEETF